MQLEHRYVAIEVEELPGELLVEAEIIQGKKRFNIEEHVLDALKGQLFEGVGRRWDSFSSFFKAVVSQTWALYAIDDA